MNDRKYLIVNADDFGASDGVNRGIIECHKNGVVTSASLMVTGNAIDEAVAMSLDCPNLSVGLHWDVWGEDKRVFDINNLTAVRDEFYKQLDLFFQKMGEMPTHIDSHRHAHIDADKVVFNFFQHLVEPLNVPLREDGRVYMVLDFYGKAKSSVRQDIKGISVPFLQKIIREEVQEGWTEIMCHPGYIEPGYKAFYSKEREVEIRTLTDPSIRKTIYDNNIRLVNYNEFKAYGGMNIQPEMKSKKYRESYFHQIWNSKKNIDEIIPEREAFILIDEEKWGAGEVIAGRPKISYPEKNGLYWGPPPDSQAAIKELQRLHKNGVRYLVVAWPAFWWLDHYEEWSEYLHKNALCMLKNERVFIFNMDNF